MNKEKLLAGIDAGHINTKAIIMKGQEILGYCTIPTGFDVVDAAQTALNDASDNAGISSGELGGIVATGIFKDMIEVPPLKTPLIPTPGHDNRSLKESSSFGVVKRHSILRFFRIRTA